LCDFVGRVRFSYLKGTSGDHMRTHVVVKVAAVVLAAGLLMACGDPPTRPSPGSVLDPAPVPPTEPRVSEVTFEGPEVIPLGGTGQFRLIGRMTDGSERDLTTVAEWGAEHPLSDVPPVRIDAPGVITGEQRGQASVYARFEHHTDWQLVIVLPEGTHRLVGYVREAGGGPPVADALVEVTSGVGRGLSTVTDYYGFYALFGVAGETHLRVSKAGYFPTVVDYLVITENQSAELRLDTRRPPVDVSGVYTLTITAASECRRGLGLQGLPEEAAVRTYTATVEQNRTRLLASLAAPTVHEITFGGRVEPERVSFDIPGPSHSEEEPTFVDSISDSRALVVDGRVWASLLSSTRLEGLLDGRFQVFEAGRSIAECRSTNHQFVMQR
jgi:hypothetical protein